MADQTGNDQIMRIVFIILLYGLLALLVCQSCAVAQPLTSSKKIIVAADGSGDYKTIQAALNSLPDAAAGTRTIFIKRGTYSEKLFIEKNNIILEGEDRDKTIITQDIARDEWRCDHPDDWGVATMNVNGNDITLQNLPSRMIMVLM